MATPQATLAAPGALLSRMEEARARTDALFELLRPESFYERAVAERHRLIFYLGHVEAFDRNLLGGPLDLKSRDVSFDKLFAFGIDPVDGGLPSDTPSDWPSVAQVRAYVLAARADLDRALCAQQEKRHDLDSTLLNVAIEHRLMHAETLSYLLHNLPFEKKLPQRVQPAPLGNAPAQRAISIPAGVATIGQSRPHSDSFGWDNEFEALEAPVPDFTVDAFPITNGEFLKFVQSGGYQDERCWSTEDWEWRRSQSLDHPHFWIPLSHSPVASRAADWQYRSMFAAIPLPLSAPVYVSHAEASAFARWANKKLPTEAQWHRAAYATPEGAERRYPWGDSAPDHTRGNFHHARWDPTAVDAHPAGASAFGAMDLLGNGWEWTSTPFAPLPGFTPFSFYPGYSANFFDGKHFVMKGGSPRTDACMLRRSFRNWFQPHYPYVYATFRCVED